MLLARRLPVGLDVQSGGEVHARVWAPACSRVELVWEDRPDDRVTLTRGTDGYHEALCRGHAGDRYRFRLDDGTDLLPDMASRYQPDGPFGPSAVVDPSAFTWTDQAWPGIRPADVIVYEMHVGTFTKEGTWATAATHLPALVDLGITVIEMMPVADFVGRFGWGYDGVNLFAPTRLYGAPDDLRAFIDRAHALGLGVILDVVYNHVGPSGAYFNRYSTDYFSKVDTEWGPSINFDGPNSAPVREFFEANAAYWIEEFHFDGLRLDATQSIVDHSPDHVIAAITRRVRAAAGSRSTWIVAENERQHSRMDRPVARGGFGLDALWNDDYHHSAIVALTGRREAYYTDYLGEPQEFVSAAKHGFLYQGQWYLWQQRRRGDAAFDLPSSAFVACLENHDQVANSATGQRLHQLSSPGKLRALTALTLLGPWTPMLFQGQEFASSAPFLYFADHDSDAPLAAAVRKGRGEFLAQFPRIALPAVQADLADPGAAATFERCKLDHDEARTHQPAWILHADLLRQRRTDAILAAQGQHGFDGAVFGSSGFLLRWFGRDENATDRLLVVNLGHDLLRPVVPEPLLAPPDGHRWILHWTSDDPKYGGTGTPTVETRDGWRLPSECALLFVAEPRRNPDPTALL